MNHFLHLSRRLYSNKSLDLIFNCKLISNQLISRNFSFQPSRLPRSSQPVLYNTEELEDSLKRAKETGGQTTDLLRRLVQIYTKQYDYLNQDKPQNEIIFNRIKQMSDDLKTDTNQSNDSLNAFILEFFTDCGDLESALEAKNRISSDFRLDSFKVFNLATLLVKNGRTDAALNLIESQLNSLNKSVKFSRDNREDFKRFRDQSINRLLNSLIERQTEIQIIRKFFEMCVRLSPTGVNKKMLDPLIKMHLVKGDLPSALEEYGHCFTNYGVIPLNSELMRVFIETKDEKSLQTVVKTSSQVYGPYTTGLDLAAAYLYCGLEDEAQRELSKINRTNQSAVRVVCQRFIEDERIDCLHTFVLMTKPIGGIDRTKLFSLLIRAYKMKGQTDKAKQVIELMREENIESKDML